MRMLPAAAAALLALGAVGSTGHASTKVYGNGLAASCSTLAIAGEFDRQTLNTCTLALEAEALGREVAAKTHVNRGVVYLRRESLTQAAKDFERAERLMPKLGEIYVNRAVVLMKQRRWAEAVSQLDKGIALTPDELEKAYFNRALAREQLDDVRGAYFDFRQAATLAPEWEAPQKELQRYTVRPAA